MNKFEKLYNKIICQMCQMLQSTASSINDKINLLFDESDLFVDSKKLQNNDKIKNKKDKEYINYNFGIEPSLILSDNSKCFYLELTKPIQISYDYISDGEFEPGYRSFPFSKDLNNKSNDKINDEIFHIDVETEEGQNKVLLFSTLSQEDKYKIIKAIIDYLDSKDFSEDFNQQVNIEEENRARDKADLRNYHEAEQAERYKDYNI